MFFELDDGANNELIRATRPSLDAPFDPMEPIDVGFSSFTVGDPELSHDGHTLLFTVRNGTNGDYDLYEMTR